MRRLAALVALGVMAAGCSVAELAAPRPFALSRAALEFVEPEALWNRAPFLPWASDEPWVVVVDRPKRQVELYRRGEQIRTYPAVFGRVEGRKLFEGDRRTPSGVYRISRKRIHDRFHRFLDIDYPTETDLDVYREARAAGRIPRESGKIPGPGNLLGIHGTDDERLNRLNIDWTLGCVSLRNRDMTDLYEQVPEGTLVVIHDDGQPWGQSVPAPDVQEAEASQEFAQTSVGADTDPVRTVVSTLYRTE